MGQKKILVADDEEDILDVLEKKLKDNNYEVITVSDGRNIVDICKSQNPDLVMLDIIMPGVDGYTVATLLRKERNLADTPIIFMTAKELEFSGIYKRLSSLGYCDFVAKPFVFKELLTRIKEKIG